MDDKVTPFPKARKPKRRSRRATPVSKGNVHVLRPLIGTAAGRVLHDAQDAGLTEAVVMGWDGDGHFYYRSSISNGPDVLWLLQLAQRDLFAGSD
jgi:hypothetical protein